MDITWISQLSHVPQAHHEVRPRLGVVAFRLEGP